MKAVKRFGVLLSWCLALALVSVAVLGGRERGSPSSRRDELRIFTYSFPTKLDPAGGGDPQVISQVFERLTDVDADSKIVPALAESWTIDPGGRRVVFTLRPDLEFSDGSPIDAIDVVRSWMRLIDPQRASPYGYLLDDVAGAATRRHGGGSSVGLLAIDRLHVVVRLARPANDFPAIASSPRLGVAPPRITSDLSGVDATQVPASGPYRVESLNASELVLEANAHYWAGRPAISRIRMIASLASEGPLKAFTEDEVDYAIIRDADAGWIASDRTLGPQLIAQPLAAVAIYGFAAAKPPFDDPRVRRAFAEAVDWKRMVAMAGEADIPATGLIPPGVPGRSERDYSPPFDPAEARELLAEAGYPDGKGFPPVTMTSSGFAWDPLLAGQWESQLGVEVRPEIAYGVDLVARLESDPPKIWSAYWSIDYPSANDFLGVIAGVGQQNNYSRWVSREFEDDIQAARSSGTPAQAQAGYGRAEELLQQDVPIVGVAYRGPNWVLARSGLVGMDANGLGLVRLSGVSWSVP